MIACGFLEAADKRGYVTIAARLMDIEQIQRQQLNQASQLHVLTSRGTNTRMWSSVYMYAGRPWLMLQLLGGSRVDASIRGPQAPPESSDTE